MIIITNKSIANSIEIPCNLSKSSTGSYTLTLHHTVKNKDYTFTVTDTNSGDFFYTFSITPSALPNGEYEYSVNGSTGLLRIQSGISKKTYNVDLEFKEYDVTI